MDQQLRSTPRCAFPVVSRLSARNPSSMRIFAEAYTEESFVQQAAA